MNLQDLLHMLQFLAERFSYNKEITVEIFNEVLKFSDRELREQIYGNENSPKGWETSQKRTDSLRHAKASATIALTTGSGSLPVDYLHAIPDITISSATTVVKLVTEKEKTEMRQNAILEPSETYPIAVINDGTVQVYPTSISSISFPYLKHPTAPSLVLKSENGIYVYDSVNSVQLEWEQEDYPDILRLMLQHLGISVDRADIAQYMEAKQQIENS